MQEFVEHLHFYSAHPAILSSFVLSLVLIDSIIFQLIEVLGES